MKHLNEIFFKYNFKSEFARERHKVEVRRNYIKLRVQTKMDNELHGYIDWICKAGKLIIINI